MKSDQLLKRREANRRWATGEERHEAPAALESPPPPPSASCSTALKSFQGNVCLVRHSQGRTGEHNPTLNQSGMMQEVRSLWHSTHEHLEGSGRVLRLGECGREKQSEQKWNRCPDKNGQLSTADQRSSRQVVDRRVCDQSACDRGGAACRDPTRLTDGSQLDRRVCLSATGGKLSGERRVAERSPRFSSQTRPATRRRPNKTTHVCRNLKQSDFRSWKEEFAGVRHQIQCRNKTLQTQIAIIWTSYLFLLSMDVSKFYWWGCRRKMFTESYVKLVKDEL